MKSLTPLAVIILIIASIAFTTGGILAYFSDSETSRGNFIATGSIDLKVNGADDEPWGGGIGPVLQINSATVCIWYSSTVELWNAGVVYGTAYIQIKNLVDPAGLAGVTNIEIKYDNSVVVTGTMAELAGTEIRLGGLSANAVKQAEILLHVAEQAPEGRFDYDLQFALAGSWSDSELSQGNYLQLTTSTTT